VPKAQHHFMGHNHIRILPYSLHQTFSKGYIAKKHSYLGVLFNLLLIAIAINDRIKAPLSS
jgi:hypothetical protein